MSDERLGANTPGGTPRLDVSGNQQDQAIRLILEGTASATGEEFFVALVKNLAKILTTDGAWVTEYFPSLGRLRARAFWFRDSFLSDFEYDIKGTPCERVISTRTVVHIPEKVIDLFPDDHELIKLGAVSYMGLPIFDPDDKIMGHLAVIDSKAMYEKPKNETLMRIFASRAGAELVRLRAEANFRAREDKLVRLVDSAMDAIVELNGQFMLTRANRAVRSTFGYSADDLIGKSIDDILDAPSCKKFRELAHGLEQSAEDRQKLWIPGGLVGKSADGASFPAEASLSRFEDRGKTFFTLILRNVNDRIEAEKRIDATGVRGQLLEGGARQHPRFFEYRGKLSCSQKYARSRVAGSVYGHDGAHTRRNGHRQGTDCPRASRQEQA